MVSGVVGGGGEGGGFGAGDGGARWFFGFGTKELFRVDADELHCVVEERERED